MFLVATSAASVMKSVIQLIVLIVIFIGIVFLAYFTSKIAGRLQNPNSVHGNMEIIETIRVQNNKYIQLVRVGEQYITIAIGKDEVHFLTEIDKNGLTFNDSTIVNDVSFKDVMSRLMNSSKNK